MKGREKGGERKKLKNTEDKRIDGGGRWRKERNRGRRVDVWRRSVRARSERYNITLRAHLSPFSALFSYAKPSSPPYCGALWDHEALVQSTTTTLRLFSRHLLLLFRLLSHPLLPCLHPLSHPPYRWCSATPPPLPPSFPCPFISSTSVFGSKPFVPFQQHADKWISLLIKSFARPPRSLSSFQASHPTRLMLFHRLPIPILPSVSSPRACLSIPLLCLAADSGSRSRIPTTIISRFCVRNHFL